MAGFREMAKDHFPLQDISSVVRLFKEQLESSLEPDLALLSIVAGAVENSLTCSRTLTASKETDTCGEIQLPPLDYRVVEGLYNKFHALVKGTIDFSQYVVNKYASRELVKKVSDVIWNSLTRSFYKDRAHLQSLFSYLTGNKLDCFGVAFAVVAGCQALGFRDVHLALSEDHAWVVFGENGSETAEVTWHGKGNEDKRGQEIGRGIGSHSWLYMNGYPVVCSRVMEVAALVSAINPSLTGSSDSLEVALLQQELLWLLYDLGHLTKYPMALGNLGDLEEIAPTSGRPPCSSLFDEAVNSARLYYNNQHVYPYTYQGGYFYRSGMYKEAFESWANAADVIRQYNYSRDDEEIYKEFLEIANELIPHIIKVVSSGHSARSILKDPECFAHLLRFYDGICQWEEGAATPVLHIGWARPLVNTISKFDAEVRSQVIIMSDNSRYVGDECAANELEGDVVSEKKVSKEKHFTSQKVSGAHENNNNYQIPGSASVVWNSKELLQGKIAKEEEDTPPHPTIAALTEACAENILNRDYLLGCGQPFIPAPTSSTSSDEEEVAEGKADIDALLPEDNLGPGKSPLLPIANGGRKGKRMASESAVKVPVKKSLQASGVPKNLPNQENEKPMEAKMENSTFQEKAPPQVNADDLDKGKQKKVELTSVENSSESRSRLTLRSHKMTGLKDLLLAEKLNTHAISLQLTAQSQVHVTKKSRGLCLPGAGPELGEPGGQGVIGNATSRAKRARRD
ncbi:menin [Ischnura elegans]|uniref:menin n=1 Tax=Ischnura elegans TaxID=197161 RepID=UPI001ED872BF|nr:menin [Ischnura elegans]